ncbi:hypothetical protein NDU88_011477, partial [Pleurodeles waltl]
TTHISRTDPSIGTQHSIPQASIPDSRQWQTQGCHPSSFSSTHLPCFLSPFPFSDLS